MGDLGERWLPAVEACHARAQLVSPSWSRKLGEAFWRSNSPASTGQLMKCCLSFFASRMISRTFGRSSR